MGTVVRRAARLFAEASFIEGLCRVLDMGATLNIYNHNTTPGEADFEAIQSDWASVGDELFTAIKNFDDYEKKGKGVV